MIGTILSILIIVALCVLVLWAINYMAGGAIPGTPKRVLVVVIILLAVVAAFYSIQHPFLRL